MFFEGFLGWLNNREGCRGVNLKPHPFHGISVAFSIFSHLQADLLYSEERRHALRWRLSALFVSVLMTSEKKKQSLLKEFVTSGISVGTANIVTLPLGENERRGIL